MQTRSESNFLQCRPWLPHDTKLKCAYSGWKGYHRALTRVQALGFIATRKHINCNVTAKQRTCGCWASGNHLFLRVLQVLVLENRGAALISKHGPLPHVERWRLNPMWWNGDEHSWGRQCAFVCNLLHSLPTHAGASILLVGAVVCNDDPQAEGLASNLKRF